MDSHRTNVGFRRIPEGMGFRGLHRHFLNAAQGRASSRHRIVNGADKMTIKMLIASVVLAVAAHAVVPSLPTDTCAPVIECTTKEPIE